MRPSRTVLAACAVLLLGAIPAQAALVQSATNTINASTTIAKAFTSNVTAGSLLIAIADCDTNASASGVSDGVNTWTRATNQIWNFSSHSLEVWSASNVAAGATTVTMTFTASSNNVLIIAEYSGVVTSTPLDQVAAAQSGDGINSTPADSGNTATTTQADELQIGATVAFDATHTAANGFTQQGIVTNGISSSTLSLQDKTVAATGAYQSQTTLGAANQWAAAIATFKLTTTPTPRRLLLLRVGGTVP